MLKKLFYVGLGISIIAVKEAASFLLAKRQEMEERQADEAVDDEVVVRAAVIEDPAGFTETIVEEVVTTPDDDKSVLAANDLTEIIGIGPTYAKRLSGAGITTFAALAAQPPETLRHITRATGKSADPKSWIAQAAGLQ